MSPSRPRAQTRLHVLRGDDAGFTLLEVVVSFVLFAIVALSATAAIANSVSTASNTTDRVTAANIAQQVMARAKADQTSLKSTLGTQSSAASPDPAYTVTQSTSLGGTIAAGSGITCPVGDWINYTVSVSWRDRSATRTLRMDTVFAC